MTAANEYKSAVGLDQLYYALITEDDSSAYTAGTPAYLAPVAEVKAAPAVDRKTQYMDDQPYDALSVEGETTLTLTVSGIPMDVLATITGRQFDTTTGRLYDNGGVPPYCALGFRSMKSNGTYRYYWYLKGKFDMPGDEAASKSDKVDPRTKELTFTAVRTIKTFSLPNSVTDSVKRVMGDADSTNFSATNWFAAVQYPAIGSISALSLSSSVPTDAATGISVSADQTLTFNNALQANAVYGVSLMKASDGTLPAAAYTLDVTKKIMTINPDASLTASTAYIIAYNVIDIYGQTLKGAVNFTTA